MAQIKVYFEQEIKSFGTSAELNLATLSQRVRRSFGVSDTTRLTLKYRDEDDDWITVATEVEFTEAVNHCGSPLKLFLFVEQTNKNQVPFVPIETQVLAAPTTSTTTTTTTTVQPATETADQNDPLVVATGPEDELLEKLGKQKKFLSKKEKKMLKMKIKKERKELKKARKNQKNLSAPEVPSLGKDVCLLVSSQLSLDEKKKAATLMKDIEVMKMKKKAEVKAIKDEILQKKLELSLLKEEKKREIQTAKHQLQTLLQEAKNREEAAKKREETQPLVSIPLTPLRPVKVETPKAEKVEVARPSVVPLTRLTPALKKVEPEVKQQEKTNQEEKIPVSPLKPVEKSPETQTPEQKKTENAKAEGERKVRFTDPFAEQLEALHIMGFVQSGRNLNLLKKYQGDVPSVVAELLGDF